MTDYRKDFPLLSEIGENTVDGREWIYIDNAATSQRPQCVIDAERDFYLKHNANPLRGNYPLSVEATELYENARKGVRDFIGAKSAREIIFTRNTTESMNLVAYSYGLNNVNAGDEILVSIDREFIISMKNSIIFVVIVPVIQILSILLALLVNQKLPGINVFRTLFYIPVVTSMVAVSIMWGFIFDTHGIINTMLSDWGWIKQPLGFLNSKYAAMPCLMFITVWQGLGYYMMMYLAGLQGIPQELTEAAQIDGANILQTIFKIKIPLLKPYVWLCSLNSVISAIGVFDVVFVLTKGGPNNATTVINYYSYTKAFGDFQFGYAAAIGAIQGILTTMLSIIVFVYGKRGGMTNNE